MRDTTHKTINAKLASSLGFSAAVTLAVVVTSGVIESRLGVPQYWPWLLTGLQVLSLWAAGARRWWGWLLGASVQPPWIAYAMLTGQWGFIPGCAISAMVQTYSYLRSTQKHEIPGTSASAAHMRAELSQLHLSHSPDPEPETDWPISGPWKLRFALAWRARPWPDQVPGRISGSEAWLCRPQRNV